MDPPPGLGPGPGPKGPYIPISLYPISLYPISLYPISLYPIPYIPISYPYPIPHKSCPPVCGWTKKPFFEKLLFLKYTIFLIFDAKVASTRPGTHLKRCGSKFCVGWWPGDLRSFHMDPIGEKNGFLIFPNVFLIFS